MRALFICSFWFLSVLPAHARIADILNDAGMPFMNVAFSSKDLSAQEKAFASNVSGRDALALALNTLLTDDSSAEAPLSLFTQDGADLLEGLNRSSAKLFLVHLNNDDHRPEHGESVADNWIFCLSLPEFSDHLFWVVIDRKGLRAPYVYGFN